MASSNSAAFSLDHLSPPPSSEQLCYVHCNFCDTVLAVSVPCSSLFKTVTVRCGHCTNLLSVNMRGLFLPAAANQLHVGHAFLPPPDPPPPRHNLNLLDEIACPPHSLLMDPPSLHTITNMLQPVKGPEDDQHSWNNTGAVNRPSEKRQRVPSAYNRFIKDEIHRIKAGNPDITHREAFSAAAKNWAHFPHIHFGLMPDQGLKKNSVRQQEGDHQGVLHKDGFYAAAAAAPNMGVTPFK